MNKLRRKFWILNFPSEREIFPLLSSLMMNLHIENFPFSNQLTSNQLATNHHPDIGGIERRKFLQIRTLSAFTSHIFSHFLFEKFIYAAHIHRTLCCMLSDDAHHFIFKWRVIFYSVTAAVAPHTISLLYCPQHIHIWCQSIFFRLTINITKKREKWEMTSKDIMMNARGEDFYFFINNFKYFYVLKFVRVK